MKKESKATTQKKTIHLMPIINTALAYLALILLAGLAFEGIKSLVDAKPTIQTAVGVILVLLLVKTALKR